MAVACAQSEIFGDAAAGKNIDPSVKSAALERQCSVNSMQCERRFDSWPATRKETAAAATAAKGASERERARPLSQDR